MPLQQTSGNVTADAYGGGVAAVPNYIEDVFSTYLYAGNSATNAITNGIDLAGKGGLVWIKNRTFTTNHFLADTARGIGGVGGSTYYIASNSTGAQSSSTNLMSADATGFTLLPNATSSTNGSYNYASWTFRKQPKFFDVVTYTGDGTNNRAISHNLGSTPGTVIVKCTSSSAAWPVWHRSFGGSNYNMYLNLTIASSTQGDFSSNGSASFTSATFPVSNNGVANTSGETYVAYLYAHDAGGFGLTGTDNVISCGSYTGNGSSSGPTVTLGYEPQWVLVKRSDSTSPWALFDNMRGLTVAGQQDPILYPNAPDAEVTGIDVLQPLATGFQLTGTNWNVSSGTYIYIAIRRGPMKVPTDGTKVYNAISRTGTGATANVTGVGFPPDMLLDTMRSTSWTRSMWDRLRGPNLRIATNQTSAETSYTDAVMAYGQDGVTLGADGNVDVNGSGYTYINWFFRRAPSFFDEVCYTGTGSARTVTHNLGVPPELMIVKSRDRGTGGYWWVYSASLLASEYLELDGTYAKNTATTMWNDTRPTSSVFSVGTVTGVNASGSTFVAYLFATCAGVSKCGSYTGTGATQTISCGFTGGARFVMVKATSTTGNWVVVDTARGMVAGTDPYLNLNTTAAEVNANNIYTTTGGFQLVSADANTNANGTQYLYLAIA